MYIRSLEVREGFLDGLSVEFVPGLNVIIGARGTGKTSIIELLRYCLEAGSFTEEAARRGRSQAESVLQGGTVRVTVEIAGSEIALSRDSSVKLEQRSVTPIRCTVLAQNEIEVVGAQALGRLHLIDRFLADRGPLESALEQKRSEVASFTTQLASLAQEVSSLSTEVDGLADVLDQLAQAENQQALILETIQASDEQRQGLAQLQAASVTVAARDLAFRQATASLRELSTSLEGAALSAAFVLEEWPGDAGPDQLSEVRAEVGSLAPTIADLAQRVAGIASRVDQLASQNAEQTGRISGATRDLRARLEALQQGASAVTRQVTDLQERAGQLRVIEARIAERRNDYRAVQQRRDHSYLELDALRDQQFLSRLDVARHLNQELAPNIRVELTRSGNVENYVSAIVAGLRGSGLRYNNLAPLIARALSPLELVRAVEAADAAVIARACGIPLDRAVNVVSALSAGDLASIVSSDVHDTVALQLLDGADHKDSTQLSIGQRCTAVLPVLLSQHGDPLVIDQPEDHLDNAFIASTLVRRLAARSQGDQFIFASHNANIPVLGEADRVIVMDSDGARGFAVHQGTLQSDETIHYVTSLMEGGREAFRRRAQFYSGPTGQQT